MRTVAVDWSGRKDASEAEHIWVAEVAGGRLAELRNGRTRAEVVEYLAGLEEAQLLVGLDFAFSLPSWWLREREYEDVCALWAAVVDHGVPPFFGTAGTKRPAPGLMYRRTDEALRAAKFHSKSPFQVGGAGAVGIGSLRGMPHLLTLAKRFRIWPFEAAGPRTVLEIYPRALTGPVNKSRWTERHAYLQAFAGQDPALLERAAGSEDAFDAAVSALRMADHVAAIAALPAAADPDVRLEGWAWAPGVPFEG